MIVQVKEIYSEVFKALQENIDEVLQKHALNQVGRRIAEAEQRVKQWEVKYGCDYDLFAYKTSIDETYINELESEIGKQDWEGDLFEWEVDAAELAKWRNHLQKLLSS